MGDRIVVGVPGLWKDRSEIIRAVATANGSRKTPAYLAAGAVILDLASKKGFGFEVYDKEPRLADAFRAAGQGRLSPELLEAIDRHTFTIYVVSEERGLAAARSLLRLAAFLLDAGGLAVKVESSGISHTPDRWRYLAGSPSTLSLYAAFVVLVGGKDFYYSCGMHAFGLPDASITSTVSQEESAEILSSFNHRQLLDATPRNDGDPFSTGVAAPEFRLRLERYGYDEEDLRNNPFGRWHLDVLASGRPRAVSTEPMFMAIPRDDPRLIEAMKNARATVGYFVSHFQSPHEYGIHLFKAPIPDGDSMVHLWLNLVEVRVDSLVGEVFEAPPELKAVTVGKRVEVKFNHISDWSIRKSGTLIGGYTLRLNREWTKPELRSQWDLHTGFISYAPLTEILS